MSRKAVTCLCTAIVPWMFAMAGNAAADEIFKPTTIITVPGGLKSFDIGFVDADIHTYVLADRTNAAIDVVDTRTNTLTRLHANPPFAGVRANPGAASGPDGTLIVDHREVWAGDAPSTCTTAAPFTCSPDSSVKVIDLKTGATTAVLVTGGQRRADELCEDVGHEVVLVANDDPVDSFITFWSTEAPHKQLGKISFLAGSTDPNGGVIANGIEQCKYDPRTHKFYVNIPATFDPTLTNSLPGVVVVISRDAPFRVEHVIPVDPSCIGNAGLTIGPDHQILLGCSAAGPGTGSVIIDDRNGSTLRLLPGQSGDEIWYNPGDNQYFLTGDTSLGVVDPNGVQDTAAATQAGSHSVAADMVRNQVYVPINSGGGICGATSTTGCIAVYTAEHDDKCLADGMPVMDHDDNDDPVFMRTRCDRDRRADHGR